MISGIVPSFILTVFQTTNSPTYRTNTPTKVAIARS
jgi:hypothetical protein